MQPLDYGGVRGLQRNGRQQRADGAEQARQREHRSPSVAEGHGDQRVGAHVDGRAAACQHGEPEGGAALSHGLGKREESNREHEGAAHNQPIRTELIDEIAGKGGAEQLTEKEHREQVRLCGHVTVDGACPRRHAEQRARKREHETEDEQTRDRVKEQQRRSSWQAHRFSARTTRDETTR